MYQPHHLLQEARMDRFGLKLAAHLDEQPLAHDISERLRIARQLALEQRKRAAQKQISAARETAALLNNSGGVATLGGLPGDGIGWLGRLAGFLPIVALAISLGVIDTIMNNQGAQELAQVDLELLTDDLPPAAHTDPGFAQYLKFGPPTDAAR